MSPLTRYEAIGIFGSVAVMALALAFVRFQGDGFGLMGDDNRNEEAAVVMAGSDSTELRDSLTEDVGSDGRLDRLIINDVSRGTGREVEEGDTVTVHYIGALRDGTQFDNSYTRGEPFTFTVGEGKVIEGWEKGIVGMQKGGERILVIPPQEAYGNRQVGPIPPNSPLVFAIELVEIQ